MLHALTKGGENGGADLCELFRVLEDPCNIRRGSPPLGLLFEERVSSWPYDL